MNDCVVPHRFATRRDSHAGEQESQDRKGKGSRKNR